MLKDFDNNYKIDLKRSPFPKHHPVFHISGFKPFILTLPEYRYYRDIFGFRTNYKKKCYEYRVRYKYKNTNDLVPSEEVENNPRNQDI
ncbi:hypothetical protein H8356DRAFT_1330960 [Neocallimastix lanati (nom. inval.)]|nr:hypothetical protein H8356DRAFT_1330960 [Neocallimastix sp. JGI-2020a]